MSKLKRAIAPKELYGKKRNILEFTGDWLDHIGNPEIKGTWFIYGHSGNGKTSYCTQFAKYLTNFGRVWYNGLEEGDSLSFEEALKRVGMETVGNKFLLIEDRTYESLKVRLKRRNRADFVFIDSLQRFKMTSAELEALELEFPNTQFIIIGHAEGKKPEGRRGKTIEYFAFVKIWIEGFKAFVKSRYGGTEPFVIYPKRAAEYWTDIE